MVSDMIDKTLSTVFSARQGFGDKVKIVEIQVTPETIREYGTTNPLVNGKIKIFGP